MEKLTLFGRCIWCKDIWKHKRRILYQGLKKNVAFRVNLYGLQFEISVVFYRNENAPAMISSMGKEHFTFPLFFPRFPLLGYYMFPGGNISAEDLNSQLKKKTSFCQKSELREYLMTKVQNKCFDVPYPKR